MSPKLDGHSIRACVDSYRYPDGCNEAGRKHAANMFCQYKGYSRATQWQWQTTPKGRPRRKKRVWEWTEQYQDGYLKRSYTWKGKKRRYFTTIECS
ncbi:hypothetical protein [Okeania sp. SIO2B3]|uniref:hypothetical protein n=1 Tax=Okeania sp. SIO2B3 TaxID=2607784 RepID=UPI0013C0E73A|nr:hypothetical protein [Okeania sp. SIO2B3]NET45927.1 hypothetical protein [Okeania sp. SIO2B3]